MPKDSNKELLPILIIPGFMSSGLEIKESSTNPNWVNKRLWLNLGSLGLSAMYFGSAQRRSNKSSPVSRLDTGGMESEEEQQQANYKSGWLHHMMLNSTDLRSDPPGIKVRAIDGLEGVDYLTPGTFTNMVSYVFGPAIIALEKGGYNSTTTNLMASPYDWRLSPDELEKRDKYFTRTMGFVEKLYKDNQKPIILIGHSMGCKNAHYFLNFVERKRGRKWIDQHIHTYMPIGAPHLGAPKALRSTISGDKMSLDTFLNDEEALVLGRSFGSGPWLLPTDLPDGVPASCYIRPHGVLEVSFPNAVNTNPLVEKRETLNRPNRYQMQVIARGFHDDAEEKHMVRTPFHRIDADLGRDVVVFRDRMSFATHPKPLTGANLQFLLHEPGLAAAKKEKEKFNPLKCILCCLCFCFWPCVLVVRILKCLTCGIVRGATLAADAIVSTTGSGSTLAFSESIKVPKAVWKGQEVTIKVPMYHVDDYGAVERTLCCTYDVRPRTIDVFVKLKWHPFVNTKSFRRKCSSICQPSTNAPHLPVKRKGQDYHEFPGYDLMEREGLGYMLDFVKQAYDGDKLLPRSLSSVDPPPVNRVHAIYGINLPTEIGAIYKRQDTCLTENRLESLYTPDRRSHIDTKTGYSISAGVLMETPKTKQSVAKNRQVSGDGTVPYWSLQHCKTWDSRDRMVSVAELEKAEHRDILADNRFHAEVLRYSSQHAQMGTTYQYAEA
ncbi:lecithin:cholesterol acyltransferase [Nitzschia inconspicua]|uniref:Lecithin:cholesterol acyltransferase n=1 Tax=Nitzschia inconspicua TaxID=303405 RepID=A0A9K3Q5C3_9STRA|nr:lecithin:cholesterol acyltransferase [Nitzschia inconspicua]